MSCKCNTLRPFSVDVVTGTSVTFNVQNPIGSIVPLDEVYTLVECACLSNTTGAEYVYINIGGTAINVYDKAGDWLQYGRIKNGTCQKRLRMIYGAIPADRQHFTVIHALPCQILTAATTDTTTEG